ncbi:MAG: GNAT family N-acetyltransferase [Trichlorobacter sp.]|nr:GNAT family N-acetyltransferase [Trichlorobacter sp.]
MRCSPNNSFKPTPLRRPLNSNVKPHIKGHWYMKIRKAQLEDHQTLLAIWEQSVRASHDFLSEQDIQLLIPMVRDQALPGLEVWVLCDESSAPIGFMGLDNNKLEALFISPTSFRRGGGKLMLEYARKLKGELQVDVNEQNPSAVAFYLSNGFVVAGRSPTDSQGLPFPLLHLNEAFVQQK